MHVEKYRILEDMGPQIEGLLNLHTTGQRLWMPVDLLFPAELSHSERLEQLQAEGRNIPPALWAVAVLNALTESGLPHFHRLLAVHLGNDSVFRAWTDLWTAEEDRHDGLLHDLFRVAGTVVIRAVEELQYAYLRAGFRPNWELDPYQLLAYTAIQEQATQIAHGNLGRHLKRTAPGFAVMLGHIAGEEGRHAHFYREVFRNILLQDPGAALLAFSRVARNFDMPGVSIPGFADLEYVAKRLNIFGPLEFKRIMNDLLALWNIEKMNPPTDAAKVVQRKLLKFPQTLERSALAFDRQEKRELTFSFLPGVVITI